MNSGSVTAVRTVLGLIAGMTILLGATAVTAQTPEEACAADSLYLVSPEGFVMTQQTVGRPGLILTWEDLDTSEATCYTLTGLDNLGFTVDVEGGFNDQVDRFITFATPDAGTIGHQGRTTLRLAWQSQGNSANGVLAGNINLANNGGILRHSATGSQWGQTNNGLPMTWFQTNVTALAEGSGGFMVAAFTAGQTIDSNPKGLYVYRQGVWTRIGEDTFASTTIFTKVAISSLTNDYFAVGTSRNGLYVTRDGGATFTRFTSELDPSFTPMPTNFNVGAVNWSSGDLFVFLPNYGLFKSQDGVTFQRSNILVEVDLDVDPPVTAMPSVINEIAVDPSTPGRILLSLNFNGVWESNDAGDTWHDLYGDLHVPSGDPELPGEWVHSAKSVAVDAGDSQIMVAGYVQEGLYRTADGGQTWTLVGTNIQPGDPPGSSTASLTNLYVRSDPDRPGVFYVLEDGHTLATSTDGGLTWQHLATQPYLIKGRNLLVSRDGSGDLLMASYGGGIYVPGSPLHLSDTYNTTTSSYLRTLDLGLDITFDGGDVLANDTFNLVCQTFQGWAVWRAPAHDRLNMTLLGLYDRVNPESCIEGYCGDESYDLVPQCYTSKRAACFQFDRPDSVTFFDDEVYNGFSYYYAVSTFDYGNTALSSPQNNTNSMIFSPRFRGDDLSPFTGGGNSQFIQINSSPADPVDGETIYAYPNPLRRDAGIPGSEGETVIFTNLPPQSRVRVFTTAGDDVINLGWDNMRDGNIYWRTVNRDGEPVSPGVYLYKVESPQREDHWGKVVIIR